MVASWHTQCRAITTARSMSALIKVSQTYIRNSSVLQADPAMQPDIKHTRPGAIVCRSAFYWRCKVRWFTEPRPEDGTPLR